MTYKTPLLSRRLSNTDAKISTLLLIIYFLIWSIAPAIISSSVALDVSEGINWGHEWQWGYYKHPPLSSWLLYSFYQAFGHIGPYLLSQIHILLSIGIIYKLGTKFYSPNKALLGALLSLAIFYYTYPSLEYNHNIAQFPIWAGLSLLFYQSTTQNRYRDWILLGIVGGLGMLTKYSVAFLLIPMAIYLMLPKQWYLLRQPKPWLSAIIMLTLFSPHLVWLVQNDWLPFVYASGRSAESTQGSSLVAHFSWINFSLAQLVAHLPLLIMLVLSRKHLSLIGVPFNTHQDNLNSNPDANTNLLCYMWLAPLLFVISLSLIFGIGLRDMWGMPMWSLSGLIAVGLIKDENYGFLSTKLTKYLMFWLIFVTLLMLTYVQYGHSMRDKPSRMDWPEKSLSLQAQQTWHSISSCSWDSLSGDRWLTALVAMNAENSRFNTTNIWPSLMISGSSQYSPWMTKERLLQHGTLVMSQPDSNLVLPLLDELPKDTMVYYKGKWQIQWPKQPNAEPLIVHWTAYVPKNCAK